MILVVGGATLFLYKNNTPAIPSRTVKKIENLAPVGKGVINVKITDSGFSPSEISINAGDKVIWTNEGKVLAEINSDPHPTHTLYPKLNLGVVIPRGTARLIFTARGKYTYHNHLNPSQTGTIEVK